MPATSLRNHSPPNETARHRTLRRAMASASAKMPRTRVRVFPGIFGLSVGPCPDLLTTNADTSERNLFGNLRVSELEWGHLGAALELSRFSRDFVGTRQRQTVQIQSTWILFLSPDWPPTSLVSGQSVRESCFDQTRTTKVTGNYFDKTRATIFTFVVLARPIVPCEARRSAPHDLKRSREGPGAYHPSM